MTEPAVNPDRRTAVSSSFRRQLSVELGWLRDQKIIPASLAADLGKTYGLDEVAAEGSQKLVWVIFLIGVLLIGCGVIALVAWHWEEMSQTVQLLLIVGAMLIAHISGYLLWFHGNRPKLGHALVLLGTILFFANIGLIAQIFHIPSDERSGFLALAAGAAAIALALGSVPNFLVAQVGVLVWSLYDLRISTSADSWFAPLFVLVALLTVRFVHRTGSSLALLAGWLTATILAAQTVNYIVPGIRGGSLFLLVTLASGAIAAGLSSHQADLSNPSVRNPVANPAHRREFADTLLTLAAIFISFAAFLGGFLDFHRAFKSSEIVEWSFWVFALVLIGIGVTLAFRRAFSGAFSGALSGALSNPHPTPALTKASAISGYAPLGLAFAALVAAAGSPAPYLAAFASNVAVLITGSVLATTGVREELRGRFWFGTTLILATVLARFFEYETNLWLKGAAFITGGVLVLVIGLAFERRIRRNRESDHSVPPSSSPNLGPVTDGGAVTDGGTVTNGGASS